MKRDWIYSRWLYSQVKPEKYLPTLSFTSLTNHSVIAVARSQVNSEFQILAVFNVRMVNSAFDNNTCGACVSFFVGCMTYGT